MGSLSTVGLYVQKSRREIRDGSLLIGPYLVNSSAYIVSLADRRVH